MSLKLSIKQLQNGKWAAFSGKKYYPQTVSDTEREARIKRLEEIGREGQDRIDAADAALGALGALSKSDPHGYLC